MTMTIYKVNIQTGSMKNKALRQDDNDNIQSEYSNMINKEQRINVTSHYEVNDTICNVNIQ